MSMVVREYSTNANDTTAVYRDDGSVLRVTRNESVYVSEETPVNEDAVCVDIGVEITKAREDARLVSGWANVAVNANGSIPMDWSDDIIAPETLEKAAIQFMQEYRESGEMHRGDSKGTVVESIVFTKEKQEAIGIPDGTVPQGWFITVKVADEETFAKVKDGTYKMFSIQGSGKRVKVM